MHRGVTANIAKEMFSFLMTHQNLTLDNLYYSPDGKKGKKESVLESADA